MRRNGKYPCSRVKYKNKAFPGGNALFLCLSDGFALICYQTGFLHAFHGEELGQELLALFGADLVGHFDAAAGHGLALEVLIADLGEELVGVGFADGAYAHHQQVAVSALGDDLAQYEDDDGNTHNGDSSQEELACAQQDAHGECPEHVAGIHGILHRGAETDDGQSADHAHGQLDGIADAQYDRRGDDGHQHQRESEVVGEHDAAVVLLVDPVDEQTGREGHEKGDQYERDGVGANGHILRDLLK